ncbi:MAG: ABC transporter permease [Acidobacteriota bacterium]
MKERLPPRLAERWLSRAISDIEARQAVLGDLYEEFSARAGRLPHFAAQMWYWLAAAGAACWYLAELMRSRTSKRRRKGENRMEQFWTDARLALRAMRRTPLFTLTAVLTLALGIGANSAVFSVVYGVLIKPLPYEDPHELVSVAHTAPGLGFRSIPQTEATYYTYRRENRVFENLGIWRPAVVSVTGLAEPERVRILFLSEGVLPALKVQPALGRAFDSQDTSTDSPRTVLLSYGYWQRRFGGDAGILGQTLRIESIDWQVIGILPQGFRMLSEEAQLFLPIQLDRPTGPATASFDYQGLARLRPGATLEDANQDLARMIPQIWPFFRGLTAEKFQEWRMGPNIRPLKGALVGDVGGVLWLLLGTVGLVLLIACANVANLFLVRAESRRREVSVRAAMGASRGRIARQYLTESGLLGLVGGLAGLGLAQAGILLLPVIAPENLPRLEEISASPVVLLFTLAVSLLAGLLFGAFPVVQQGNPHLAAALKEGGRQSSEGKRRHRLRQVLATSQVSLALVLLIGAGLMLRSFQALGDVHPGFERPEEVLSFRLGLPRAEASNAGEIVRTHLQILDQLAQIPGVLSLGASSSLPMDGWGGNNVIYAEGFPVAEGQLPPRRLYKAVAGTTSPPWASPCWRAASSIAATSKTGGRWVW